MGTTNGNRGLSVEHPTPSSLPKWGGRAKLGDTMADVVVISAPSVDEGLRADGWVAVALLDSGALPRDCSHDWASTAVVPIEE